MGYRNMKRNSGLFIEMFVLTIIGIVAFIKIISILKDWFVERSIHMTSPTYCTSRLKTGASVVGFLSKPSEDSRSYFL